MSQIFQIKNSLHFGATVFISCLHKDTKFYMYANGISLKTVLSIAQAESPYDPTQCLFLIKPPMRFQSQQFIDQIVNQSCNDQQKNEFNEKKAKTYIEQFQFELKQNIKLKQQQQGFPLTYNQNFMLQHVYSSNYLCFKKIDDNNQYNLELTDAPNSSCIFSFKACYSYQKQIHNYVPFNSAGFLNIKFQQGLFSREMSLKFVPNSIYDSWVLSDESSDKLKIELYKVYEQIQYENICYGDLVWISHLESGSFMKLSENGERQPQSLILKKIKYTLGYSNIIKTKKEKDENKVEQEASTQKIILQKTTNESSAQKAGLWQIIPVFQKEKGFQKVKFLGGKVRFGEEVRFLNVKEKVYLSVRKVKKGRNKFEYQFAIEQAEEENTVFQIHNISSKSTEATTEDLFVIKNVWTKTYLTLKSFEDKQKKGFLTPSITHKKQDNFKFTKIDFYEQFQNNYLLSTLPYIKEGIKGMKRINLIERTVKNRDEIMLRVMCENLLLLLSFSFDLTQGFEASDNKLGKMTYNHFQIQNLMKEQNVIGQVITFLSSINVDILFQSLNEQEEEVFLTKLGVLNVVKKYGGSDKDNQRQKKLDPSLLKKITIICFKILRNCCKANIENSLLLFKNLDVVIKFLGLGCQAQNFMIDSFTNLSVLEKFSQDNLQLIIDQYEKIYKIKQFHEPLMFQILANFVKYEGKGINKNQLQIYHLFFQSNNGFIISVDSVDGKFYVSNTQLLKFSKNDPLKAHFLGKQIKFSAELAFDRNYVCSKALKKLFPLQTLLHYLIQQPVENTSLKQGFLWLVIHCYLNERPRYKNQLHLIYDIPWRLDQEKVFGQENYEVEMKLMKQQGLSSHAIEDILSCIQQDDLFSVQNMEKFKRYIIFNINHFSEEKKDLYSSKMEAYLACLKFLIQLSLLNPQELQSISKLLKNISQKILISMADKKDEKQKLQNTNFRQILLEMLEKNVLKKFNLVQNFDGIEDEVNQDNICSVFINFVYYQNILLSDKHSRDRKSKNGIIKLLLGIIEVYNSNSKEKFFHRLMKAISAPLPNRQNENYVRSVENVLMKDVFTNEDKGGRQQIMSFLVSQFYNSNSYSINFLSLRDLLHGVFEDQILMQEVKNVQLNIADKQKQSYKKLKKICNNIQMLIQTSEIWLNVNDIVKGKSKKFDSVRLLFINRLKSLLKIMIPVFNQQQQDALNCLKYIRFVESEKQQMVNNTKIWHKITNFLLEYRQVMIKMKKSSNIRSKVFIQIVKFCNLFITAFICNSSQNKEMFKRATNNCYIDGFINDGNNVDFGETMLITQFLKNNIEDSILFVKKNEKNLLNNSNFAIAFSKLLLQLTNYWNEPILQNLRKIYVLIFDFSNFKEFLWLNQNGNGFNLEMGQFKNNQQPYFYHINAIQVILRIAMHLQQSRSTIKQHLKKCLKQEYLYALLEEKDYFSQENSEFCLLKVMIYFKLQIMRIIELVYFPQQTKKDQLILKQFRRQNSILSKMIAEAHVRRETPDFRKIYPIKGSVIDPSNKVIAYFYENYFAKLGEDNLLEVFLDSTYEFCSKYSYMYHQSKQEMILKMVNAAEEIQSKINSLYEFLYKKDKVRSIQEPFEGREKPQKYPVPYAWLFDIKTSWLDDQSVSNKRKSYCFLIEAIFSKQVYSKFLENESQQMKKFLQILKDLQLKEFEFLRKISQFMEDAFQKLSNESSTETLHFLKLLVKFLTLWIDSYHGPPAEQLRVKIGKSELIFPILNYFERCKFTKQNKQLFLHCIQFFNQLIGENGNRFIQKMFNQYFTNKVDSIEFFLKIKTIFDQISFEDKVTYKCMRIYQCIERLAKDSQFQKDSQFIVLSFFIRLCEGGFKQNQLFLSQLSDRAGFNIMSGIWEVLKIQSKKYGKKLVNIQNYSLITQCLSTIKELVEGPCTQNQNRFLKRDFFLTILEYFEYSILQNDLKMQPDVQERLCSIGKISPHFISDLRIYLNRDKITQSWMPSQVKYRCASLICSLLSENNNLQGKRQLLVLNPNIITRQIQNVYKRFKQLKLQYNYENLEAKQNIEVILPLGFKLFQLLQYYPQQKINKSLDGYKFFQLNSRKVQVMHQQLSIVIFPCVPQQISIGFKNKFLEQADRSSVNSKLRSLQDAEVQNKQSDFPYGYLLLLCVVIITILDIIAYGQEALPYVQYFNFFPIFGIIVAGEEQSEKVMLTIFIFISALLSLIFLILQFRGATYFREQIGKIKNSSTKTKVQKFLQIVKFFWNNLEYFHYFLTLLLCILSIFNPFFDGLLLLVQLNRRSQTFSAIIDAITATLDQLGYPDQCQNLYHCFVFSLDLGFRADAGIVGFTDDQDTILEQFIQRTIDNVVVNFVYLFVIKIIIQQILGAIIIDKFASLRENKEKIQEDERSLCFICGLGRTLLDRDEDGFERHKDQYHNVWNYLQFLIYIRKSKISNFSGVELYVYEQQKSRKLNWFPINRSYHLQEKEEKKQKEEEEESQLAKLLKILDHQINELKEDTTQIWNLVSINLSKKKISKQPSEKDN